ncbi:MAG: hypothetical protein GY935_07180, partial [Gammaproteobacteria bacterium]|nr:hypothetical protein [Gammaproteobacteria bacterium]
KDIEGQIVIDMHSHNNKVVSVEIQSSRPLQVQGILIGKSPHQVLSMIPLMYNICGIAQARTSLLAIQRCLSIELDPAMEIARDMLVLVENAREHLFRIFIDWPKLLELNRDIPRPPTSIHLIREFKQALFTDSKAFELSSQLKPNSIYLLELIKQLELELQQKVFGISTQDWLAISDVDGLDQWMNENDGLAAGAIRAISDQGWNSQGYSDCPHLPQLDAGNLLKRLDTVDADEFIAYPDWQGSLYETTVLTRQQNHGVIPELTRKFGNALATRWVARLHELASIPQQLKQLLLQLEQNHQATIADTGRRPGIAQTEAARGRLIHRVKINRDRISQYQILAPTEWNFHPRGLITKSLGNISANSARQLEQLAGLIINAIDPCVGYTLRIH